MGFLYSPVYSLFLARVFRSFSDVCYEAVSGSDTLSETSFLLSRNIFEVCGNLSFQSFWFQYVWLLSGCMMFVLILMQFFFQCQSFMSQFYMSGKIWKRHSSINTIQGVALINWDRVFENGPSKICVRQSYHIPSNFLKAVFLKLCLVHSWILVQINAFSCIVGFWLFCVFVYLWFWKVLEMVWENCNYNFFCYSLRHQDWIVQFSVLLQAVPFPKE